MKDINAAVQDLRQQQGVVAQGLVRSGGRVEALRAQTAKDMERGDDIECLIGSSVGEERASGRRLTASDGPPPPPAAVCDEEGSIDCCGPPRSGDERGPVPLPSTLRALRREPGLSRAGMS